MKKNFINKNKKFYFLLLLLILIIVLIMSCKKVNILGPNNIPPPTAFPNIDDEKPEIPDYPNPTPVPDPPEETEEKPIEIKPEVVEDGIVFGSYVKRFKFKNEWYVLAANEYKYDPNKKRLEMAGKGALLKIANDGNTIIKIHSSLSDEDLDKVQYWTNLTSDRLVIDTDRVYIESTNRSYEVLYNDVEFEKKPSNFDSTLYKIQYYYEVRTYRDIIASDSLINWKDSQYLLKTYKLPEANYDNPNNWQGRIGCTRIEIVFLRINYTHLIDGILYMM